MSQPTQQQIEEAVKSLSNEDVVQFFNERVKQNACPTCFTNNWSFVGGPDHNIALMALTKNGDFQLPPPNVPIFGIACNHCGYIRTHALGIVASWKLNRGAKP